MGSFSEAFANRQDKTLTAELPKLDLTAIFHGLDSDALYEVSQMGDLRGIKYGLYLACPQLQEEGAALFAENKLASPEDIVSVLSLGDITALWQGVLDISDSETTAVLTQEGQPYTPKHPTGEEGADPWSAPPIPGVAMPTMPSLPKQLSFPEDSGVAAAEKYGSMPQGDGAVALARSGPMPQEITPQQPWDQPEYDAIAHYFALRLQETAKNM